MIGVQQLQTLESSILFDIITVMHETLYGYPPFDMADWTNKQLVSWFEEHYVMDENTGIWYSVIQFRKVH